MIGHNEWICEASNDIGNGIKTVEARIEFMVGKYSGNYMTVRVLH